MKKVIVIGAGPAGMMAAIAASKENDVVLLEGNEKLGKKLFITGKGRCNVTNAKDIGDFFDFIPGNPYFLYSALYTFTNQDTMNYFEDHGIKLKVERGGRVFPNSDKSSDIIRGLEQGLKECNVKIRLNSKVKSFRKYENRIEYVELEDGSKVHGDAFIICTGGKSYPLTGSRGDGFKFAESLGHHVTQLKPSLIPLEAEDKWVKDLMGLSLKNVTFTIFEDGKKVYSNEGEMLFTHFGVTGPLVLSGSRYVKDLKNKKYEASINLKPALDYKELDARVQRDFKKYINKDFKNSLDDLLPQKLIPVMIHLSGINETKKVNEITKEERRRLVELLQNLRFKITGLRPIDQAIVTAGGVNIDEVDPSTMKSRIIDNLSFAGEVLDVDAFTGGYNVQIAFSTGYLAGVNINK